MASPIVQEAIESSTNTAGTSHVITLPTATAGQLLLIILDKGSTSATINAHASLTELLDEAFANGLYIAYRWMDGTEPASYTLISSASTRSARIAYRISGAENPATTAPQIGTTGTGTSATPNPPASAAPPSSKDYLFVAFFGQAGEEADDDTWVNTPPTNYTPSPPRQKACGTVGTNLGGKIGAAERALTTGSAEDPGTFGVDVSAAWRAQTITIHPYTPTFADIRQDIINGLDSAQSEGTGWDAEVKAKIPVTDVVRTSNTVVTITLSAAAAYDITAQETIEATIPASALEGGTLIVATPTFTVDIAAGAYFLEVAPGSYGVTGVAAGVLATRLINALPSSYAITGFTTLLSRGFWLGAGSGTYAITGANASLLATRLISANPGNYGISGFAASLLAQRILSGDPGGYVITGIPTGLLATRLLNAESGAYIITGLDTLLSRGYLLVAVPGTYVLTGFDAELLKGGGVAAYFLLADPGNYGITGFVSGLLAGRVLNAESGIYVVTGANAATVVGRILATDPGAYVITGSQASLLAQRLIEANPGDYGITGADASLRLSDVVMMAGVGSYIIVGSAAKAQLDNLSQFPVGESPDQIISTKGKILKKISGTTYIEVS